MLFLTVAYILAREEAEVNLILFSYTFSWHCATFAAKMKFCGITLGGNVTTAS